jgi:hypothetical protein
VLAVSIITALMIEAISSSETSVNFYKTARGSIPGYGHLHTRRCENMKSREHGLLISSKNYRHMAFLRGYLTLQFYWSNNLNGTEVPDYDETNIFFNAL